MDNVWLAKRLADFTVVGLLLFLAWSITRSYLGY